MEILGGGVRMKMKKLSEEKGVVLVLAILLLLVATLIGISSVNTANYDIRISGNKRISEQAFYAAEAGINEFMGRFRDGATDAITDDAASNPVESTPPWRLILARDNTTASKVASRLGISNYTFIQSLQTPLDFGVEVRHKVNIANNVIFYGGVPVYIVRSYGYTPEGGNKIIEVELNKIPNLDPPGALYSERPINVTGNSTHINGNDHCGTKNKPGIMTILPETATDPVAVDEHGNPDISGDPEIQYSTPNLPLKEEVEYLRKDANFTYYYNGNQTLTGYSDSWGIPTGSGTTNPLTYEGPINIVYFKMDGNSTLKLAGGSHGAGILLVDGNLELNGGFKWYGLIIVTGALDYTGGGDKNVTGGIMTGESATVSVDVGGNAGILYCSALEDKLKKVVSPFRIVRWREIF